MTKIQFSVVFSGGHSGERSFALKEGQGIIIGRMSSSAEVVPPNSMKFLSKVISRKHAQIFAIEDKLCIRDTKSSSGTFVNSQRLSSQGEDSVFIELLTGDEVSFGEDCFVDGVNYIAVSMKIKIDTAIIEHAPLAPLSALPLLLPEIIPLPDLTTLAEFIPLSKERMEIHIEPSFSFTESTIRLLSSRVHYLTKYREIPVSATFQGDVEEEFNLIWNGIQEGFDVRLQHFLTISLPYAKTMNDRGAFGSPVAEKAIDKVRKYTPTSGTREFAKSRLSQNFQSQSMSSLSREKDKVITE